MIGRVVRAVTAALALLALVVGVPSLLVVFGRSPLDGDGSLLEQLGDLPTQAISDHMAFGLLTIAAWTAWAVFIHGVVAEAAVALGSARRPKPLAWNPFELTARRLVAALTMTMTVSTGLGPRAGNLPSLGTSAAVAETVAQTGVSAPTRLVVAIADDVDVGPDANVADGPGHHQIQSQYASTTGAQAESPQPPTPPAAPAAAPVVTVAPGDSPWALAQQHLGDGLRWRELWDLNRGAPQADGRAWVIEDLIRPGWQLRLPTPLAEVAVPPAVPAAEEPTSAPADSAPETERPTPDDGPDAAGQDEAPTSTSSSTSPPTTAPAPDQDQPTEGAAPEEEEDDNDDRGLLPPLSPPLAGITGATVLATSVGLLLRRLRRSRSPRTAGAWRRRLDRRSTKTDEAVTAATDVPLVRWAGQALAEAMRRVEPERIGTAAPVAVELSEERGIELLWDQPVPDAVSPWKAVDWGWAWVLPYDPDAPVPADHWSAPIPALVTVGDRDGRQLMVDLEAFGSVSVTGDPAFVADFGRALGLELGADEDLADAFVSTVGFGLGADDYLRRVRRVTPSDALATLRSATEAIDDPTGQSAFSYRIAAEAHYLEATVVLVDAASATEAELTALAEASPAGRGVATVVLGHVPTAGAHVVIGTDGMACIDPLGITFRAAGTSASVEDDISALIRDEAARAAESLDGQVVGETTAPIPSGDNGASVDSTAVTGEDEEPAATHEDPPPDEAILQHLPGMAPPTSQATGPQSDAEGTAAAPQHMEPEESLLVRVLGVPSVPDRPGLRRRELLVTVYMACRATPVTASGIQNAVWGGRAVEPKTLWNVITYTRTALGDFEDGSPVMPPTDRRGGTLRLSDRVVTDLALLQGCYRSALHLPSSDALQLLRRGLALVQGMPFDAPGYEWASRDDQFVADAATVIENAAELLARLAQEAGEIDVAREALAQGLRGLPGNEVLYRTRMRLEHDAGNMSGVEAAWNELNDFLLDLEVDPSDETVALHTELTRSS